MSEDATGGDGADGGRGSTVRRRIMSQRQTERMTMVLTPKEFRRSPPGLVLFRMVEHPMTQVLLMVLLVVTLFLPDIWVVANPDESQDAVLNSLLMVSFVLFMFEIAVRLLVSRKYRTSLFFAMDLLGTLSILMDISWILSGKVTRGVNLSTLRAARMAKIAAESGRLMKLLRVFKCAPSLFLHPASSLVFSLLPPFHAHPHVPHVPSPSRRSFSVPPRHALSLCLSPSPTLTH